LVKVPRLGATAARSRHPPLPNAPNGVRTTAEGASFVKTLNADPYPTASCPSARCDESRREVSVSKRRLRRREGLGHEVNYHCRSTFHQRRVPFLPAPAMGLIAATTILMAQLLMPARHWSQLWPARGEIATATKWEKLTACDESNRRSPARRRGARALSTWTRRGCCRLVQRAVYGQAERNVSRRRRRSRFRFCCHLRVRGAGRRSELIARRVNLCVGGCRVERHSVGASVRRRGS
jgi:hypothetical protein